jgi:hypothetical protein
MIVNPAPLDARELLLLQQLFSSRVTHRSKKAVNGV